MPQVEPFTRFSQLTEYRSSVLVCYRMVTVRK